MTVKTPGHSTKQSLHNANSLLQTDNYRAKCVSCQLLSVPVSFQALPKLQVVSEETKDQQTFKEHP